MVASIRHCLLALTLGVPALALGTGSAVASEAEDTEAKAALVELEIHREGAVMTHPGSMARNGDEVVLTVDEGGKKHEVKVTFHSAGEAYDVSLTYRAGGKKVMSGKAKAQPKDWAAVASKDGKTKVAVRINPDGSSHDKIEIQPTDDPIGGLE